MTSERRHIVKALLPAALLFAAGLIAEPAQAQSLSIDMGDSSGEFTGRLIELFALVTVLSLAPGILVMVTAFTRIVVVFAILRRALGLQQTPPNMLLVSLALFLTAFVMGPVFQEAYDDGVRPLINDTINQRQAAERIVEPFRTFMETQVEPETVDMFAQYDSVSPETGEVGQNEGKQNANAEDVPLRTLIPAFIISELSKAFQIGFLLFLPFLIIDLVTASLLMSMGMMMLPPVIISLPFKIVFFVMVDGWQLVTSSLMKSFGAT